MNTWNQTLESAKSGDRNAIADLLMDVASDLRSYAINMIDRKWQSYFSQEDLLQETYAEAISCIEQFEGTTSQELNRWLKSICRHNYLDVVRNLTTKKNSADRRVFQSEEQSLSCLYENLSDDETPSRITSRKEEIQSLSVSIKMLPQAYAAVITLVDILGGEISDVAKKLGCSVGAVHMRRRRALDQLRKSVKL